jgi:hypothetical protein
MWCSEPALRAVCTLVGGGFLAYSFISAFTGWFYDSDDGWIERAERPVAFWVSVAATAFLGTFILGVGYQWPAVAALFKLFEDRF